VRCGARLSALGGGLVVVEGGGEQRAFRRAGDLDGGMRLLHAPLGI